MSPKRFRDLVLLVMILFLSGLKVSGVWAEEPSESSPPLAIQETVEEVEAKAPVSESEQWAQHIEDLDDGMLQGKKSLDDADELYHELTPILRAKRHRLTKAFARAGSPSDPVEAAMENRSPGPEKKEDTAEPPTPTPETPVAKPASKRETIRDLYETFTDLYDHRIALLQRVSPELHAMVTGTGIEGVQELKEEIERVVLHFRFRAWALSQGVANMSDRLTLAPLPVLWALLQLTVAFMIFRGWRGWAAKGLPRWRARIMRISPRKRHNLRLARFLWYTERVRSPLEWMALAAVLYAVIDFPEIQQLKERLWVVPMWILDAWFVVALINAMAARGSSGLFSDTSGLRLRSLWLVACWVVLLMLGLDLSESYAGQGTLYAWNWILFELLALPMLVLLVVWWRPQVFRELENQCNRADWIEGILQNRKGLKGYVGAAVGGVYLLCQHLLKSILVGISELEGGQRILANLYKRGIADLYVNLGQIEGTKEIPAELRDRLFTGVGDIVEKAASDKLSQLAELVKQKKGGRVLIVAERGGGKSLFLQRLKAKFDGRVVVVDCPLGGFDEFQDAFARALGVSGDGISPDIFTQRLEALKVQVVAFDNVHRLTRPVMDGQKELDRIGKMLQRIQADVVWVYTIDRMAWHYIRRARAHQFMLVEVIELPRWTEEQIGALLDLRSAEAGISPDFGRLVLPRRLEAMEEETPTERNRSGIYRIIWYAAEGNPGLALQHWANSLAVTPDGEIFVRLPQEPAIAELEGVHITVLLMLRVIIQSELASAADIGKSLKLPAVQVSIAIHQTLRRGWIEEVNGRYGVSWSWLRIVTRVLVRRNLLPQ